MHRKIIIKAKDLEKELCSFLTQVRADIPVDWYSNALALVRDAVIEACGKMGITLEIDERIVFGKMLLRSSTSSSIPWNPTYSPNFLNK